MVLKPRQQIIQAHIVQDDLEGQMLQLKPKLDMIDQMEKLAENTNNKLLHQQVQHQRQEITSVINQMSKKFNIDIVDIYSKLEGELTKNKIHQARDDETKRRQTGQSDDVIDLLDQNALLLKRGVRERDLEDEQHPVHKYYQRYKRMKEGFGYEDEPEEQEDERLQQYLDMPKGSQYHIKYIAPHRYYTTGSAQHPLEEHLVRQQYVRAHQEESEKAAEQRKKLAKQVKQLIVGKKFKEMQQKAAKQHMQQVVEEHKAQQLHEEVQPVSYVEGLISKAHGQHKANISSQQQAAIEKEEREYGQHFNVAQETNEQIKQREQQEKQHREQLIKQLQEAISLLGPRDLHMKHRLEHKLNKLIDPEYHKTHKEMKQRRKEAQEKHWAEGRIRRDKEMEEDKQYDILQKDRQYQERLAFNRKQAQLKELEENLILIAQERGKKSQEYKDAEDKLKAAQKPQQSAIDKAHQELKKKRQESIDRMIQHIKSKHQEERKVSSSNREQLLIKSSSQARWTQEYVNELTQLGIIQTRPNGDTYKLASIKKKYQPQALEAAILKHFQQ